ncbi:MAG: hypothetical protein ACQEXV_07470 [Bacillota bacterium]
MKAVYLLSSEYHYSDVISLPDTTSHAANGKKNITIRVDHTNYPTNGGHLDLSISLSVSRIDFMTSSEKAFTVGDSHFFFLISIWEYIGSNFSE